MEGWAQELVEEEAKLKMRVNDWGVRCLVRHH
jgi:hypothetical protein